METVQSSGGTYSYTFRLSSDLPYGTYTVVAGKGNKVAVTEFIIIPVSSSDNSCLYPIGSLAVGD